MGFLSRAGIWEERILLSVLNCWTHFHLQCPGNCTKCCFSVTWNRGWQLTLNSYLPLVSSSSLFGQHTAVMILTRARDTPSIGYLQFSSSVTIYFVNVYSICKAALHKVQSVRECTPRTPCFHGTFSCRTIHLIPARKLLHLHMELYLCPVDKTHSPPANEEVFRSLQTRWIPSGITQSCFQKGDAEAPSGTAAAVPQWGRAGVRVPGFPWLNLTDRINLHLI